MNTQEIIDQLQTASNPERQKAAVWYFPTSMKTLGVPAVAMRALIKSWWKELKTLAPPELIGFTKELVETRVFECQQIAFELLWKNKKAMSSLTVSDLESLGRHMDNWATTDAFAVTLAGWTWRNHQITDKDILKWIGSENRWWKRAAIVATVGMNLKSRGGTGDVVRTLMVCEKVVSDRDDIIEKALSWALRELSKHDKKAVENFMENYDDQLAGRVRREVRQKLKTGKKNG